jgi:transcriptional regulator with XRE-family HTH domain
MRQNMDLVSIGTQISLERKKRGWTQSQLAERAGISRATLAALETGAIRELGFNKVAMLLACLQLNLRIGTANGSRPTLEDLQLENAA